MATKVADVMTPDPVAMDGKEPVTKAAAAMRDHSIGTVVVMTDGKPCGVVTDRDITVKAVATGGDLSKMPLEQICSKKVVAVAPGQSVDDAVQVMKSHDVKRILVVEGKQLKGIVSLGVLVDGERRGRDGGRLEVRARARIVRLHVVVFAVARIFTGFLVEMEVGLLARVLDRKSTRLNSSH